MRLTRHFFTDFGMGRIWFPRAGSQGLDEVPGCPGGARVAIDQRGEVAEASFGRKKNTDSLGCGLSSLLAGIRTGGSSQICDALVPARGDQS